MDQHDRDSPRLGLALSGGTAKVIAHLGVLQALEEAGLRPDRLTGTSGGSLIAVLYASGKPIEDIMALANDVNWRKLATIRMPKLGLLSSQRIEDFVRDLIGDLRFEELLIPTRVVTTNLLTGDKTVFSDGPVAHVIRASCSIPQIFAPVEIDGGLYSDGGIIEYLPVETLLDFGCRVNVGVHLGAYADFSQPPTHLLGMILRVIGIVAARNARHSAPHADVLIKPDMRRFSGFDLRSAEEMIAVGYETTQRLIPQIRDDLEQADGLWTKLKARLRPGVSGPR